MVCVILITKFGRNFKKKKGGGLYLQNCSAILNTYTFYFYLCKKSWKFFSNYIVRPSVRPSKFVLFEYSDVRYALFSTDIQNWIE